MVRRTTYHVATHGDKEIEEDLATLLHLCLHGRALFEVVAVANDDREIVTS